MTILRNTEETIDKDQSIYKQIEIKKQTITPKEIFEKRLFNVFVFGLPRSGTSMMTHALELLGVKMIYTSEDPEKKEKMDERYKKTLGEKYHPNEAGFFEVTQDLFDHYLEILSTPYAGCKMIIPVRRPIFDVVKYNPGAKVIQMWRDPEEIRQSQQAFYRGDAIEEAESRVAMMRTQLATQKLTLENHKIDTLHVQYRDVLDNPLGKIQEIAHFINAPNVIDAAVNSINPKVNRFRKEELVLGI